MTYPCSRCDGKGVVWGFSHVAGGICFKCGGTGKQTGKPNTSTYWTVHFPATVAEPTAFTGPDFVYTKQAKTATEAIDKAKITFRGIGRYPEGEAARELAALRPPVENKAPGADWTCQAAK